MTTSRLTASLLVLLSLAVAAAPSAVAADPIDPTGTSWSFPSTTSKGSGKAKGIGKLKIGGILAADATLGVGDTFTATIDGTSVSGTWSRKTPKSKRIDLTLDAMSVAAIEQRYEDDFELFAPISLDTDLTLDTDKSKLFVRIKPKKKAGTMTARLVVRLRFTGTTDGAGKIGAPTKVKARLKGKSLEVPLPTM